MQPKEDTYPCEDTLYTSGSFEVPLAHMSRISKLMPRDNGRNRGEDSEDVHRALQLCEPLITTCAVKFPNLVTKDS